jgi:hypothetical protein
MCKDDVEGRKWRNRARYGSKYETYLKVVESSRNAYLLRPATLTWASSFRRTIRSQMTTSFLTYAKRNFQSERDPRRWGTSKERDSKTKQKKQGGSGNGTRGVKRSWSSFFLHDERMKGYRLTPCAFSYWASRYKKSCFVFQWNSGVKSSVIAPPCMNQ